MSPHYDLEATLTAATQAERDRLETIEELKQEVDEWRAALMEELGQAAAGLTDQAQTQRSQDTVTRLLQIDDELHRADFAPEWVAELRGLLLESLRAMQSEVPLDAFDRLLLNLEAIRQLLRDALDGQVRGSEDDIAAVVQQLGQWLPRVSQSELADLMGVSVRQYQRWANAHTTPSRRAQIVVRLIAILRRAWTPTGVVAWFHRPRPELDGRQPIDVLDDADYEQQLLLAVRQGRAQHGS